MGSPRPGLCGGLLRYCHDDLPVQCCGGGHTNRWTALSAFVGKGLSLEQARRLPRPQVERELNFISGACVMASRAFVEQIGLMDEGYFLYCEEQDWAYRAAGRFGLVYAPDALVYHKEGATTGWNDYNLRWPALGYLTRSRIRCTWLHQPYMLPTVFGAIAYAAVRLFAKKMFSLFSFYPKGNGKKEP